MNQVLIENTAECDAVNENLCEKMVHWILNQQDICDDWMVTVVFVDDAYISRLHEKYLNISGPTDVMSFDLSEPASPREGEIYISCETALDNAERFHVTHENELCRLCAHGTYHLIGFDDTTPEQKQKMTDLENAALSSLYESIYAKK